jgi:hypothetical protein
VNPQQVLGLAIDTRITSSKLADFGSKMAAWSAEEIKPERLPAPASSGGGKDRGFTNLDPVGYLMSDAAALKSALRGSEHRASTARKPFRTLPNCNVQESCRTCGSGILGWRTRKHHAHETIHYSLPS